MRDVRFWFYKETKQLFENVIQNYWRSDKIYT